MSSGESALRNAEIRDEELRAHLYTDGINEILAADSSEPTEEEELDFGALFAPEHPKVYKALGFIKEKGPVKGLVVARHIDVSPERFRSHYVPKLKKLGVKNNKRGDGYYVPPFTPKS